MRVYANAKTRYFKCAEIAIIPMKLIFLLYAVCLPDIYNVTAKISNEALIIQLALKYQISNDFSLSYKFYIGEPIYISLTNVSVCHMSNRNLIGMRREMVVFPYRFIFSLFIVAIMFMGGFLYIYFHHIYAWLVFIYV